MSWSGVSLGDLNDPASAIQLADATGLATGVDSNHSDLDGFTDEQWGGITVTFDRVDGQDVIRVQVIEGNSGFANAAFTDAGSEWFGKPSVIMENVPEGISFERGNQLDATTWSFAVDEVGPNNLVSVAGLSDNYNGTVNVNVYLSTDPTDVETHALTIVSNADASQNPATEGETLTQIDVTAKKIAGDTVAAILSTSTQSAQNNSNGIAITDTTIVGAGEWQYSLDAGANWNDVGVVSSSSALLLDNDDKLRFLSDGNTGGAPTVTYKAWDLSGSTLSSGDSAVDTTAAASTFAGSKSTLFSAVGDVASVIVTAPVIDTDDDGVPDIDDVDDDNDGILDVEERTLYGLPAASGTLPDGTTYTASAPNLAVNSDGDFYFGVGGQNSTLVVEFDQPVDIAITNAIVGPNVWSWERAGNGMLPAAATTNGSDWVYLPGSNDALLDLSGGTTALGTRPGGAVTALSDWGVLASNKVTRVEIRAGSFDAYRFTVSVGRDSDSDAIADHLDIDSDNDGIPDNIEAQSTDGYIKPTGTINTASATNGLDTGYLATSSTGGPGLTPVNTDATVAIGRDTVPDYLDSDSDADGISDTQENGIATDGVATNAADADNDGLKDVFESGSTADGFDVNDQLYDESSDEFLSLPDTDNDIPDSGAGAVALFSDFDYRDMLDTDGDQIANDVDIDDDNDGILDTNEGQSNRSWGQYNFTHNEVNGTSTAGAPGSGDVSGVIASSTDASVGVGLTELDMFGNPASPGMNWEYYLSGADSTTFADAKANDQYIEMAFTTLSSFTAADIARLENIDFGSQFTGGGANNFTDYDVAVEVSSDGFSAAGTVLLQDFRLDRNDGGYNYRGGPFVGFDLKQGTTYTFRFYLYNDQGAGVSGSAEQIDSIGHVSFDDTYFAITSAVYDDTDNDGIDNYLDIDSDNDGIADNIEAQATSSYVPPSSDMIDDYQANSGLNSAYLATDGNGGPGLTPVNSDAADPTGTGITTDSTPDYLDLDSDGDGDSDNDENGLNQTAISNGTLSTSSNDIDSDGLFSQFEDAIDGDSSDGYIVNEGVTNVLDTGSDYLPDLSGDASVGTPTPLVNDLDFRDPSDEVAPIPKDDEFTVGEDSSITGASVIVDNGEGSDTDPNPGNTFTVSQVNGSATDVGTQITLTSGALLTLRSNGTFDYDPNGAFDALSNGETATDVFTYHLIDNTDLESESATVTITISGSNDLPLVDLNGVDIGADFDGFFSEDTVSAPLTFLVSEDALVEDPENNVQSVRITPTLPQLNDGSYEQIRVTVGDEELVIDQSLVNSGREETLGPISFGSTSFMVSYGLGYIEITGAGATQIVTSDLQGFLQEFAYQNTSQDNNEGDRVFLFEVTDSNGTTAATSTIDVQNANDAPVAAVLDSSNGTIAPVGDSVVPLTVLKPGSEPFEISVSDLLAQLDVEDKEGDTLGIGIILADESHGVWQYTRPDILDHAWTDFQLNDPDNLDSTPVPDGEALLMDPNAILRFIPQSSVGADVALQFRVWDMTEGAASNPPSTVVDDSGGVAPANTSALSSAAFGALLAADTDGDGIINSDDVDDDNDGLLDLTEFVPLILEPDEILITSRTFNDAGTVEIPSSAPVSIAIGPNLYQNFDQGTFGFETVPIDDGNANTSEMRSPAVNPYPGSVIDQNGNTIDGRYRQYQAGNGGFADPTYGEFSFVANIDDAGRRNSFQAYPVTDPVHGRDGRMFTADPAASAVPTFTDTITGLTPGQAYEFSFWAANTENYAPNQIGVKVGQPGGSMTEVMNTGGLPRSGESFTNEGAAGSASGVIWTRFSFVFAAPASGQMQVDLATVGNDESGNDVFIDNLGLQVAVTAADTDGDSVADHIDIDSDDDGITDNVEAQLTEAYIAPSGIGPHGGAGGFIDINEDGLDDTYDTRNGSLSATSTAATVSESVLATPADTDGLGSADYLDPDSDNDGIDDVVERGDGQGSTYAATDTDGDGLVDVFEGADVNDFFDVNDENVTTAAGSSVADLTEYSLAADGQLANDFSNIDPLKIDLNFRDADTDNDGILDADDIDDDNDGILDSVERFGHAKGLNDYGAGINGASSNALQAGHHVSLVKTDGDWLIAGASVDGSGGDLLTYDFLSELYNYPVGAEPLHVTVGGVGSLVVLFDNGDFYYTGDRGNDNIGMVLHNASVSNGANWAQTNFNLPAGVSASDVKLMRATGNTLTILTHDGEAYSLGRKVNQLSPGFSSVVFNQIQMPVGVTIEHIEIAEESALIVGSDDNLYRFGQSTFAGDGSASVAATTTAQLMTQPSINGSIAQIDVGNKGAYFVLDTTGVVHVLGRNPNGQLGIGNTVDQTTWTTIAGHTAQFISSSSTTDSFNSTGKSAGFIDMDDQVWLFGRTSVGCWRAHNTLFF